MNHSIILDVDTGIDDAMAIMFAVKHPDVDVRAISCVSGNTGLDNVVANTLKILDVVDAPDIPVAAGATRPLIEEPRDASYVHGADGLGNSSLPVSSRAVVPEHSVEMMRRMLVESAEKLTIVALAPLTNVALLLRMYPECADKIERILFMGGSASVGNATAVAEFNIWHDPEAASIVVNSGVPLTMYGLDVFNSVIVEPDDVARLTASDDPIASTLGALLGFRMEGVDGGPDNAFSRIGDAGAVCSLVAREFMNCQTHALQVETAAGYARGQTIVDRRDHAGEDVVHGLAGPWPTADVILGADVDAVVKVFLSTVLAG
ncbi:nucleoside hydrolase [Spelaeicoccus albus]|uniref:Pyrimidine-specific ribonucleoside hydrolase n=1 Tax=Spelaeicoccus albus TaxID=1280376 RepID=A0A7Z0ABS0_9MICO|nr:nucleoside hydrolase [Spelaeicoccus albus]NYI67215.1 pyrimidine-specific ribonucleoside hydrolase [Spelaeicoccus albus]